VGIPDGRTEASRLIDCDVVPTGSTVANDIRRNLGGQFQVKDHSAHVAGHRLLGLKGHSILKLTKGKGIQNEIRAVAMKDVCRITSASQGVHAG
jgi:hypothetical protein